MKYYHLVKLYLPLVRFFCAISIGTLIMELQAKYSTRGYYNSCNKKFHVINSAVQYIGNIWKTQIPTTPSRMNFLLKIRENLVTMSSNRDFMPKSIKMENSANIFLDDCGNWKVPIAPTIFRMNLLFKIAISCQNQSRWRQQLTYILADYKRKCTGQVYLKMAVKKSKNQMTKH